MRDGILRKTSARLQRFLIPEGILIIKNPLENCGLSKNLIYLLSTINLDEL